MSERRARHPQPCSYHAQSPCQLPWSPLSPPPTQSLQVPLPAKLVVGAVAGVIGTSAIFPLGERGRIRRSVHTCQSSCVCACELLPIDGQWRRPPPASPPLWLADPHGLMHATADMVKTRLQSGQKGYSGPVGAAMSIYKNEGIRGFYRGTMLRPWRCAAHTRVRRSSVNTLQAPGRG
jgi:hypothetical protein